jgi:PD-(D/E)XK endonuclease
MTCLDVWAIGRAVVLTSSIKQRIQNLGLSTSHFRSRGLNGLTDVPLDPRANVFADPIPKRLRFAAIGNAIAWFTERGHVVSLPIEPAVYDLVVDMGQRFIKIQVKSSSTRSGGVGFARTGYDSSRPGSKSGGYARRAPYEPGEIDFFFVVLGDGSMYLLPYDVIGRSMTVRLRQRYKAFNVG